MKLADGTEWVLVPRVATEEMTAKGCDQHSCLQGDPWYGAPELEDYDFEKIWNAAIAAAPQPPVEEMVSAMNDIIADCMYADMTSDEIARAIVKRLIRKE